MKARANAAGAKAGAPTGLWVPCELVAGRFGGPVRVTDAGGQVLDVGRGQMGFCDVPTGTPGEFVMRPAVLGKIVGSEGGLCVVRFADGRRGRFAVFAGWQLEFKDVEIPVPVRLVRAPGGSAA